MRIDGFGPGVGHADRVPIPHAGSLLHVSAQYFREVPASEGILRRPLRARVP
jgi:hypothetical protein